MIIKQESDLFKLVEKLRNSFGATDQENIIDVYLSPAPSESHEGADKNILVELKRGSLVLLSDSYRIKADLNEEKVDEIFQRFHNYILATFLSLTIKNAKEKIKTENVTEP